MAGWQVPPRNCRLTPGSSVARNKNQSVIVALTVSLTNAARDKLRRLAGNRLRQEVSPNAVRKEDHEISGVHRRDFSSKTRISSERDSPMCFFKVETAISAALAASSPCPRPSTTARRSPSRQGCTRCRSPLTLSPASVTWAIPQSINRSVVMGAFVEIS